MCIRDSEYTTPLPCCPSWNNLPFFLTDDQLIFNFLYRSYLTRHGKGPVGDSIFKEINNPYETNLNNPFQGEDVYKRQSGSHVLKKCMQVEQLCSLPF